MKGLNLSKALQFMVDEQITDMSGYDWDDWSGEVKDQAAVLTEFLNPPEVGRSLETIAEDIEHQVNHLLIMLLAMDKEKPWKEILGK